MTDSTSAVLPGVLIQVTNLETNLRRSVQTDSVGQFRLLALPVGTYKVEAALTGFERFVENRIVLTVNEERRVDIAMRVGSIEQQVEVSGAIVQVETTGHSVGRRRGREEDARTAA